MRYIVTLDGRTGVYKYPASIFILSQERWGDDVALELMSWAEAAAPGDTYSDNDITIKVEA